MHFRQFTFARTIRLAFSHIFEQFLFQCSSNRIPRILSLPKLRTFIKLQTLALKLPFYPVKLFYIIKAAILRGILVRDPDSGPLTQESRFARPKARHFYWLHSTFMRFHTISYDFIWFHWIFYSLKSRVHFAGFVVTGSVCLLPVTFEAERLAGRRRPVYDATGFLLLKLLIFVFQPSMDRSERTWKSLTIFWVFLCVFRESSTRGNHRLNFEL